MSFSFFFKSVPPVNPKLVYVYLIVCIGCGVTMSGKFKLHFACLLYSGQLLLFAINVYTNPAWEYPHWQRVIFAFKMLLPSIIFKHMKHSEIKITF